MTVAAVCSFGDGGVLLADSRATRETASGYSYQDALQKLVYLTPNTALAYAGDVRAAAVVIEAIRKAIAADPRLRSLRSLTTQVPRIARFHYGRYRTAVSNAGALGLIIAGWSDRGEMSFAVFTSPRFDKQRARSPFAAIGTGAQAATEVMTGGHARWGDLKSLKQRGDHLLNDVQVGLRRSGDLTVGGLLQMLLIEEKGISPLTYGNASFDPDEPGEATAITIKAGKWTQHDLVAGTSVTLAEPTPFLKSTPSEVRFVDYVPVEPSATAPRHWLTYFMLSQGVEAGPGFIRFGGVIGEVSGAALPFVFPAVASFGVWGTPGTYECVITLRHGDQRRDLYRGSITIEVPVEEADTAIQVELVLNEAGPWFVELALDGRRMAKRVVFAAAYPELKSGQPLPRLAELMSATHAGVTSGSDVALDESFAAELTYLFLCQGVKRVGPFFEVDRHIMGAFWSKYPLLLRAHLALGLRLSRGVHYIRVYLANMASRAEWLVDTVTVDSESSLQVTVVEGEMIFNVPEPGWYFVNVLVDGKRVGTVLLAAETEKPKFSDGLLAEDVERVREGELLLLLKRAQHQPD